MRWTSRKVPGTVGYVLGVGTSIDRAAAAAFVRIIEKSIFERNKNIAKFIEAICFGNMRQALNMSILFMTSGATDVDKTLKIYEEVGAYYVAIQICEFDQASWVTKLFDLR